MRKLIINWCILMLILCCSVTFAYGRSNQKTYVIITIDHCVTWPGIVSIQINEKHCGIKGLIDICDRNGVKPTFFFSPYDYKKVGEENVKAVAKYIVDRGCDLQLHTHPHHFYDPERNNMFQYSLDEQTEIIRHGKEKLYEWTRSTPIAHRAGGYSANLDTLRALVRNGIYFDSSSFFKEPRSKISAQGLPINILSIKEQVIQIPVSTFELKEFALLFGVRLPYLSRIRKVDIDWADYDQNIHAMLELKNNDVPTITLFLHYNSLLKGGNHKSHLKNAKLDLLDMKEFDAILKMIKENPGFEIVTFKEFIDIFNDNKNILSPKKDFLPEYKKEISVVQYGRKAMGINAKNFKYVVLIITGSMVIIILGFVLYQKRRKRN